MIINQSASTAGLKISTSSGNSATLALNQSGVAQWTISNNATDGTLRMTVGGGDRAVVTTSGAWTIPGPSSAVDAFTVSAASGANALTIGGTSAGTAVIRVNTQATTGAQTASFSATNKPGAASGSPQKWLPINADGTTYYIPLFN